MRRLMKALKVRIDVSAFGEIRWYEYGLRFLFGGAITVGTGLIAKRWGPELGGCSLPFPQSFPPAPPSSRKKKKRRKLKLESTEPIAAAPWLGSTPRARRWEALASLRSLSRSGFSLATSRFGSFCSGPFSLGRWSGASCGTCARQSMDFVSSRPAIASTRNFLRAESRHSSSVNSFTNH